MHNSMSYITRIIYITRIVKLIFKAYKKTDKIFFYNLFVLYIKMLTGYYQKNKKQLSKKARERHQNLFEEEKNKNCQYACERCRNLSEEEKEKKRQYGRERYKNLLQDDQYLKNKINICIAIAC